MAETSSFSIPDSFRILNKGGAVYRFFMDTGEVVAEPTASDSSISFFLKDDNGQESDLTLQTGIKARQGHRVSVLYMAKEPGDFAHAIAWANHTTGKVDYMKGAARSVVGDKISAVFLALSEAALNSVSALSNRHGGFINLLILPITLSFVGFSLLCLAIGGLFGFKSEKSVSGIMRQAERIMVSIDPVYAAYSEKPSRWKKVGLWALIVVAVLTILTYLEPVLRQL